MLRLGFFPSILLITVAVMISTGRPQKAHADGLTLIGDWNYLLRNTESKDKVEKSTTNSKYTRFIQLYQLDLQKDFSPTLSFRTGGSFQDRNINQENSGDSETRDILPYANLLLNTPILESSAIYQTRERKESNDRETKKYYNDEYGLFMTYKPAELPRVELTYDHNNFHDKPRTRELVTDLYSLKSHYEYSYYNFDYYHSTIDSELKTTEDTTNSTTKLDEGTIRYGQNLYGGKVSLNGRLYARHQSSEFSGNGDRFVPTTSAGTVIGSTDDPNPITSNPDPNFVLSSVDLLVDTPAEAKQLSFGLDFDSPTRLDVLLVNLSEEGLENDVNSGDFTWMLYVRDNDQEIWKPVPLSQIRTNLAQNRYEFSFSSQVTRYIKLVTTPLAPPEVPAGESLLISGIEGRRRLPEESNEYSATNWSAESSVSWKMTEKTTVGSNLYYGENYSDPFDERRTSLNAGASIQHIFNQIFSGAMQIQHGQEYEKGIGTRNGQTLSMSLKAGFLETFGQTLTYSFSRAEDEKGLNSYKNAFLLRSNFLLYEGWSLSMSNGYSWQTADESEDSSSTFLSLSSSIRPNRWMGISSNYNVTWTKQGNTATEVTQNGQLGLSLVPFDALSFGANYFFRQDDTAPNKHYWEQRYGANWLVLRDGTLTFSMSFGNTVNDENEKSWSLSPSMMWRVNPDTTVTLDYRRGEANDDDSKSKYDSVQVSLHINY